jgi:hypothetical protein
MRCPGALYDYSHLHPNQHQLGTRIWHIHILHVFCNYHLLWRGLDFSIQYLYCSNCSINDQIKLAAIGLLVSLGVGLATVRPCGYLSHN